MYYLLELLQKHFDYTLIMKFYLKMKINHYIILNLWHVVNLLCSVDVSIIIFRFIISGMCIL